MKNRPGNKILAELNVIQNSMKTQKINKSHKLRRCIFYIGLVHIAGRLLPMRSCLKPQRLVSKLHILNFVCVMH